MATRSPSEPSRPPLPSPGGTRDCAPPTPDTQAGDFHSAASAGTQAAEQRDPQRPHDSTVAPAADRPQPGTAPSHTSPTRTDLFPFISVIVPVRNEERFIRATVEQLLSQDYPHDRFEILVIDGRSTDQTRHLVAELARENPKVRLLDNPRRLSSAARNVGIRHARGEIILIVDGHCEIPSRQMLRSVADTFARTGADCLGRPQPLDVTGATPLQRAIAAARSSWLGHHPDSFIYADQPQFVPAKSVAVAYRREVFDRVGFFDERFDACEDVELNHRIDRAGLRCYFTPAIAVRYFPRETLRGLFRQMVRYGRGRVRLARKHPETLSLRTLLPAAMVVAGGLLVPVSVFYTPACLALLAAAAIYALAVGLTGLAIGRGEHSAKIALWSAAALVVVHLACAAGELQELVRRRATPRNKHPLVRSAGAGSRGPSPTKL